MMVFFVPMIVMLVVMCLAIFISAIASFFETGSNKVPVTNPMVSDPTVSTPLVSDPAVSDTNDSNN